MGLRLGLRPTSANLLGMFFFKLPQNRHPERSASQVYRGTPHSLARSRRTPRMLILPMPFGAFQPSKPAYRILLLYPPDGHGYIFSCAVIIFHPQVCEVFKLGIDGANEVELLFATPAFLALGQGKTVAGRPGAGFGG